MLSISLRLCELARFVSSILRISDLKTLALSSSNLLFVLRTSFIYSIFNTDVEDEGIEPSTLGLQSQCSPAELIPQTWEASRGHYLLEVSESVSQDRIASI